MAEWSKAHDWKSCVRHKRTMGSNPIFSAIKNAPYLGAFFMGKVFYKWDLMGEKIARAICPLTKAHNLRKNI